LSRAPVPVMLPLAPTAEAVLERLRAIDEVRWYGNFGPQERELRGRFAATLRSRRGRSLRRRMRLCR